MFVFKCGGTVFFITDDATSDYHYFITNGRIYLQLSCQMKHTPLNSTMEILFWGAENNDGSTIDGMHFIWFI